MNTINETMSGINEYLDQYDDVKRADKNEDQESYESYA